MTAAAILTIVVLALFGMPLFLVLGAAALLGYLVSGQQLELFFAAFYGTVSSNPVFIAIPLFTLAGYLMAESRTPERLVRMSRAAVGWLPGGLAMVALVACAAFTAFTGASGVTIVALGGLLMPALIKDGYPERFSLGLLTSSGSRGILFPPSLPLIVYAMVAGMAIQNMGPMTEATSSSDAVEMAAPAAAAGMDDAQKALDAEMDKILDDDDGEAVAAGSAEGDAAKADGDDAEDVAKELGIDLDADLAAMDAKGKAAVEAAAAEGAPPPTEGALVAEVGTSADDDLTQVSVDRLFMAGLLPGLFAMLVIALYAFWFGVRHKVPRTRFSLRELGAATWAIAWEIPIPLIIIVGIYGGFFTAIDAAAIVAAYVFLVEVVIYRDIPWKRVPTVFRESMVLVGGILLILMSAQALTNFFIDREVPQKLFEMVRNTISSPLTFLMILNAFLLVVGCLMDIFSAIMVVVPIITPVALHYGVNPIHLGVIFLVNLEIGFNTPPVGVNLFVGSLAFRRPMVDIVKAIVPFLIMGMGILFVVTYWPDLSLALVRWTGVK